MFNMSDTITINDYKPYPELHELIVTRALERRVELESSDQNIEVLTIGGAFIWSRTPEGTDFWSKLAEARTECEIEMFYVAHYPQKYSSVQGKVTVKSNGLWKE